MQYISDKLLVGEAETIDTSDYSDIFVMLKNSIDNMEVVGENSPTTFFCLEAITDDYITMEDFNRLSEKEIREALELLVRLRDYLHDLRTDTMNIDIKTIPKEFVPFFSIEKNIKFYSEIKSVKTMSNEAKKKKKTSKSKMFF